MNNTTDTYTLSVDRKPLLTAMGRIQPVIPSRSFKPILLGVRLEAADGKLKLSACDLSMHIQTSVPAEGTMPACLVPLEELVGRIKILREDRCQLLYDPGKKRITLNGGACAHKINTWELADYPPLPSEPKGETLILAGAEFGCKLAIVLKAAATSPGRYSNDGVLLESDDNGARLAATDGRRLVVAELSKRSGGFRGQALLTSGLVKLLIKLLAKAPADTEICLLVDSKQGEKGEHLPARLHLSGPDWTVTCNEMEGSFPEYRKVMPQSHSRFVVERAALVEAIRQVSLATSADQKTLRLELSPRRIKLAAGSAEVGESTATVPCKFAGGGDSKIITGFDPRYLGDALVSLDCEQAVIDVEQNGLSPDGQVAGRPALIYGDNGSAVRWVVMPVTLGLLPTKTTLGSNYKKPVAEKAA